MPRAGRAIKATERTRELIAAGRAEAEQFGMARKLVHFDRLRERSG